MKLLVLFALIAPLASAFYEPIVITCSSTSGDCEVDFAEPVDTAYTEAYLAQPDLPDQPATDLLSVGRKLSALRNKISLMDDDGGHCPRPALMDKFLWSSIKPGLYNGTMCTVLTKQSVGVPSTAVSCRPYRFGSNAPQGKWIMKYPPTGFGQHQYVFTNESIVYDNTTTGEHCSFLENGWRHADQDRGWDGARYDPIGAEKKDKRVFTYSGTASDVGSCGFDVSVHPRVLCEMEGGVPTRYLVGTTFSQYIIVQPVPGFSIAIDVHGVIDVSKWNNPNKIDYQPVSSDPGFFNLPPACAGMARSSMIQYCATNNWLTPDARVLLAFK